MRLYQKGIYRFDDGTTSPVIVVKFDLEAVELGVTLVALDNAEDDQYGNALMTVKVDDPRLGLDNQTSWLVYQDVNGVKHPEFVTQNEEVADDFIERNLSAKSEHEGDYVFKKMRLAMINDWDD